MQLPPELAKPAAPYQNVDVPNALRVMRPPLGDIAGVTLIPVSTEARSFEIERK